MSERENFREVVSGLRQTSEDIRGELSEYRKSFVNYMTQANESNQRVYEEIHRMRLEISTTNGELQRVSSESAQAVRLAEQVAKQANYNSAEINLLQLEQAKERGLSSGKRMVWRFICNTVYVGVSGALAILAYIIGLSEPVRDRVSNGFTWLIEYLIG